MQPQASASHPVSSELRLEIQSLTAEHAYRIDHGMSDKVFELYCKRGELIGLPPQDLIGTDAIAAWGTERVKLARISRHVETNHRLWWDSGVLCGTLYATVYRSDSGDTTHMTPFMIGDYEDRYQQEGGEWRILRRTIRRAFRAKSGS